MALVSLLGLAAVAVGWRASLQGSDRPVRTEIRPDGVAAFALDGRELWRYGFERPLVPDGLSASPSLVVDVDGDGLPEIVASVDVSADSPGATARGALVCLTADGRLRWRRTLEDELVFRGGTFGPAWQMGRVAVYTSARGKRIAWSQNNTPSWPSTVVVFDPAGDRVGRFVHSGSTYALAAFAGNAGPLLVGGGVSNSERSATAYVLDGNDVRGHSVEPEGSPFECLSCDGGGPRYNFVFPPSEINGAVGRPYNDVPMLTARDQALLVTTSEGLTSQTVQELFWFSKDLSLTMASHSDSWPVHDGLFRDGRLDHPFASCSAYRKPPVALEGDSRRGWHELQSAPPAAR